MTGEILCKLPKVFKLENPGGTMVRRKSNVVWRYHRPNKTVHYEKYTYHTLLLYYSFRDEKKLMLENGSCCTKLANSEVIKEVQTNLQLFEPYSELVDDIWCQVQSHEERESITYMKIKSREMKPCQL